MENKDLIQAVINAPKKFCQETIVANNQEFFAIGLAVGNQATVFAMTPEQAKRFAKQLTAAVETFEKNARPIQETPQIPSFLKPEDLRKKED